MVWAVILTSIQCGRSQILHYSGRHCPSKQWSTMRMTAVKFYACTLLCCFRVNFLCRIHIKKGHHIFQALSSLQEGLNPSPGGTLMLCSKQSRLVSDRLCKKRPQISPFAPMPSSDTDTTQELSTPCRKFLHYWNNYFCRYSTFYCSDDRFPLSCGTVK